MRCATVYALCAMTAIALMQQAVAETKYDPGASDTEIRLGNTMPYSGPASSFSAIGRVEAAYFRMINDQGGVNGRKIEFISYDDSYSPPKTVEQTRRLVEQDSVLLIFNSLGTASNTAIQKYLNNMKVPQLFIATGANKWNNPQQFPWTMRWQLSYQVEAQIYAQHILATKPNAKLAILYQNDDLGKDYLKGMIDALGDKLKPHIVLSYDINEPVIDSTIARLAASGADVFFNISTPKFAAQSIKKAAELNWKPVHYLVAASASTGSVLKPAGLENAQGIISTAFVKDPTDQQWKDNKGVQRWNAFMDKYMPGEDKTNVFFPIGYASAETLLYVLKAAGDDLTRANVMRQASTITNLELDMLLPGVKINTAPDNLAPISQSQLQVFEGDRWRLLGSVYSGDDRSRN